MIDWAKNFERWEGRVNHLYLDTAGLVTVGVGCQVFDPKELRMLVDGRDATEAEVAADMLAVRAMQAGLLAKNYAQATLCRMSDEQVDKLFNRRLEPFLAATAWLPSDAPDEAREVIVDMAFNLGLDRLQKKFSKFCAAMRAGDWAAAAAECEREPKDLLKRRNQWTRETLTGIAQTRPAPSIDT